MVKKKVGGKRKKTGKKRKNPASLAVIEGGRSSWDEDMRQYCADIDPAILLADGFERAFIGTAHQAANGDVAVYDRAACIDALVKRDGMTDEEAREYFEFNVEGSFLGGKTPLFLTYWPRALKG